MAVGAFGPALLDSIKTEIASSPLEALIAGAHAELAWLIDGDTLEIAGVAYRFLGVDAPEADAELDPMQRRSGTPGQGGNVRCEPTGDRSHSRLVARCYNASSRDLAAVMVQDGWSIDWPHSQTGITH